MQRLTLVPADMTEALLEHPEMAPLIGLAMLPWMRTRDRDGRTRAQSLRWLKQSAEALGLAWLTTLLRRPRFLRGTSLPEPLHAPTLVTARLTLRPHRLDDLTAWHALQNEPAVLHNLGWPARDLRRSRLHLRDRTRHDRLEHADDFLALAIILDGHLIGDVSLQLRAVGEEYL